MQKKIAIQVSLVLFICFLCLFSCKKKNNTSPTPILDSPVYSVFPGSSGSNDLSAIFTNDGNIALLAKSSAGSIFYKLSPTGNELLKKEIDLSKTNYGTPSIFSLAQTDDKGYILCGSAYISNQSGENLFLMKLDRTGSVEWAKDYGGNDDDYGRMIIPTKDGYFLVCGTTYSFATDSYNDIYVIKVTKNGDVLWARSYAKDGQQTPIHLLETKNGDYIVTGIDDAANKNIYMLRLNASGDIVWSSSIAPASASQWNWGYCAAECTNGDLMVCGTADSKVMLVRTNNTGNKIWEKTYAIDGLNYGSGQSIKITSDNSCLITGSVSITSSYATSCFLLKTDQDGKQLYVKKFSEAAASMSGINLLINNNRDNIITGNQSVTSNTNIFFTRTDADGNFK